MPAQNASTSPSVEVSLASSSALRIDPKNLKSQLKFGQFGHSTPRKAHRKAGGKRRGKKDRDGGSDRGGE